VVLWVEANGLCCRLRSVGCAMSGVMDDAVGCALVVPWVCGGLGDKNKK